MVEISAIEVDPFKK